MHDIEKVIGTLKKRSVSIADIYGRLKMERGYFDGRRRSVNEYKRRELAKQVMEAFPEYFEQTPDTTEPQRKENDNPFREKYIRLLEERVKEVEKERDFLRKTVIEKLERLEAK